MRRLLLLLPALLALSCTGGGRAGATPPDTVSRLKADSALGRSGLPGAKGVFNAMDAADSLNKHNELYDTIH